MKKFLAIVLTLTLFISVFSVGASAFEKEEFFDFFATMSAETDDGEIEEETPEVPEVIETRTEKWIEKMSVADEWGMILEVGNDKGEIYFKNGDISYTEYVNGSADTKYFVKNGKSYTCTGQFPYIYFENENFDNNPEEFFAAVMGLLGEMSFVKSYEENGVYVEEFSSSRYSKILFYFDGDNVVKWEFYSINSKLNAEVFYSVKNSDVRLPILAINITPLINFFVSYYKFMLKIAYGIIL